MRPMRSRHLNQTSAKTAVSTAVRISCVGRHPENLPGQQVLEVLAAVRIVG